MLPSAHLARLACGFAWLAGLGACTVPTQVVDLKRPAVSSLGYESPATPGPAPVLSVLDERRGEEQVFYQGVAPGGGRRPTNLLADGAPLDPALFLSQHVGAELASRGLRVTTSRADNGLPRLHLRVFRIRAHQSVGAGPLVTFTSISADLETASGMKRIGVFVRRAKVAFLISTAVDETIDKPLSIAVKELSSKVANALYGYRGPDRSVKELIAKLSGPRTADSEFDVYALGFSNNPLAIDALVELTQDHDEGVRIAAISSLGNLGASGQLSLLESIYRSSRPWVERGMAIKAVGDLGTAEAVAFIGAERQRLGAQPASKDAAWTSAILALYP